MLVPCFPHQEEWWLDLTAIFRKREYQPWRVQYVLDGVLNCLRQQMLRPPMDGLNWRIKTAPVVYQNS
jgi:hypothetical protein